MTEYAHWWEKKLSYIVWILTIYSTRFFSWISLHIGTIQRCTVATVIQRCMVTAAAVNASTPREAITCAQRLWRRPVGDTAHVPVQHLRARFGYGFHTLDTFYNKHIVIPVFADKSFMATTSVCSYQHTAVYPLIDFYQVKTNIWNKLNKQFFVYHR